MSKPYAKKPRPPKHWTQRVHECVVSRAPDGNINFFVKGGSEYGQFPYIGDVRQDRVVLRSGKLFQDEIILEVNGHKVAGFTLWDVNGLLNYFGENPIALKTVKAGQNISKDLRRYLNTRFQKGSIDHDLQQTIRDNLYLRTVPCTTRVPRNGELNGVDYTFLTTDEFIALEKSGNLLESGIFDGNHYGTPKPPKDPPPHLDPPIPVDLSLVADPVQDVIKPGAHPSSKGKRERNKSSILATQNLHFIDDDEDGVNEEDSLEEKRRKEVERLEKELGPLDDIWEIAFTEQNDMYFINHITETTQWLDPRLERVQKEALLDCADDELPYGWEKIDDPHYGSYYIDHINRRTQYENPVVQAKMMTHFPKDENKPLADLPSYSENKKPIEKEIQEPIVQSQTLPRPRKKPIAGIPRTFSESNIAGNNTGMNSSRPVFTQNPNELKGTPLRTLLVKSNRGFGFTIVGGDEPQEFLQVKSIVPNGPAFEDGKLQPGDVLVYVNDTLVLGYTHQQVVKLFQAVAPGDKVLLEVCRGYPLPFDPDDVNTHQTVSPENTAKHLQLTSDNRYADTMKFNKDDNSMQTTGREASYKPEHLTINIVKGALGFGFTIADSPYGQKVKQILDEPRCKNLAEEDVLIEINHYNVRNMSHSEVVNVLKKCSKGVPAAITIQRGGPGSSPSSQRKGFSPQFNHQNEGDKGMYNNRMFYQVSSTMKPASVSSYSAKSVEEHPTLSSYGEPSPELGRPKNVHLSSTVNNSPRDKTFAGRSQSPLKSSMSDSRPPSTSQQPILKTSAQDHYVELTIFLKRQESGFGFRIVGGYEEGSQVSVGAIIPGGTADVDGRLQSGDEILYVDGHSVVGASHHKVVSMMGSAALAGRVSLGVRRRVPAHTTDNDRSVSVYPYDVTVTRRPDEGFGFVIISATNRSGSTIGRIITSSPAERCGKLHVGDNLIAVNGINIIDMHHSQVVNIIKDSGYSVTLKIAVPDGASSGSSSPRSSEHMLNAMALPAQINEADQQQNSMHQSKLRKYPTDTSLKYHGNDQNPNVKEINNSLNEWYSGKQNTLERRKGAELHSNTKFVENGQRNEPKQEASHYKPAELYLKSNYRHPSDRSRRSHSPHNEINYQNRTMPDMKQQSSFSQMSWQNEILEKHKAEIKRKEENQRTIDHQQHQQQHPRLSPQHSKLKPSSPMEYCNVELHKGPKGFGFSIRGGKEFNNMPLFVLKIAEDGAASFNRRIKVGDQIMEINGYRTTGMKHSEAIDIIKRGGEVVRLLLRRGGPQSSVTGHVEDVTSPLPSGSYYEMKSFQGHH